MEQSQIDIIFEIQEIIDNQLKQINSSDYITIRDVYRKPYRLHELQTIKNQICRCIILGLYIPAIPLTNHLLEKFLKFCLMYNDTLKQTDKNKDGTPFQFINELSISNSKYDNKNLYENIKSAFQEGLIDKKQKNILLQMKDYFRNPYSHSDREGMYGDITTGITEVYGIEQAKKFLDGDERDLPKKQEKIVNIPFADVLFIHEHARTNSVPYLLDLDPIIRSVENKILGEKEIDVDDEF